MAIVISPRILKKLAEKVLPITGQEIAECFENRTKRPLTDNRQQHKTRPPTHRFIAPTDSGRRLKVVFITYPAGDHVIKTAFEPYAYEENIYENETEG